MAKTRKISFNRIIGGISDYNKESVIPNSVAFIRCVDYRSDPNRWTLLPKSQKESGTTVVDLPKWGERVGDDVYIYGDTGNIYKRTLAGVVTLDRTVGSSHGNGLSYFGEDGFLYYSTDTSLGRLGRFGTGTPVYVDDFLTAEGGVPLNTYSLDLELGSSQYATAADSASLSQTGDITLEIWSKLESLPAVGSEMNIMSKWNENSNQRSYKLTLTGVSGYLGSGADGALVISTNTTENPVDTTCSGVQGNTTLNVDSETGFVAGQIILIHQSRGTGAGTWQRNTVISVSTGILVLLTPLNFSYAGFGGQVRVMKQYTNVTINSGITYTAKAWDGETGGILAFVASGTVTVTGNISADGANGAYGSSPMTADGGGFRGGSGDGNSANTLAEAGEGTDGIANDQVTRNGNSGGGGRKGTTVFSMGGSGGNGTSGLHAEITDNQFGATYLGENGSDSGNADLSTMTFGGAGGGGKNNGNCGSGGNGGGIIFISSSVLTVTGSIHADGGIGGNSGDANANNYKAVGGSGAGGSILLKANTMTLGVGLVSAWGGVIPSGAVLGQNLSVGGGGRIAVEYNASFSGTFESFGDTTPIPAVTNSISGNTLLLNPAGYEVRLHISSTGSNTEIHGVGVSVNVGVWNHFAVSFDSSAAFSTFYLNGASIGTSTRTLTSIANTTALFAIGANFGSGGSAEEFLDGIVDDVRVWSDIRTSAEISQNRFAQLVGNEANLVAYYNLNNVSTDGTANANNLTLVGSPVYSSDVPFAAATTRRDIDQTDSSSGQTYAVPTAISELAVGRQTFIPTKDPQKSISINIGAKGTNCDWTVTIHDPLNKIVATVTKTNAELTTGVQEFVYSTPWTPIVGAYYHFHVTVTNTTGTPTVVSGTSNDLETAQFTSYYQFLVNDQQYHPIANSLNFLVIGNGRYIAKWDGTTYDPHRLTFPSGWNVRCISSFREYTAFGCWKGDSIGDYDEGIIFFWDGISRTYNYYINVPEGGINAIFGMQGVLNIFAGYDGSFLQYSGGDKAETIKVIPNVGKGNQLEIMPGALTMWKTLLRFGVGVTDSSTVEQGVYTYGSENKDYPDSLSFDYRISTETSQSSGVKIGMVLPVAGDLLVGWKDNASYGVDKIDENHTSYGNGSVEFLISDEGGIWKEKKINLIRADFNPVTSGQVIGLQYKTDGSTVWSNEATQSTVDERILHYQTPDTRHFEYQVRLNMRTTGDSPVIKGVTIEEDLLETEKNV